ncbi:MAG: hypothetical protein JNL98_27825 [Bryobacterales bacterium]|nr:hypothetical protein [Bryobacterales bacterium]
MRWLLFLAAISVLGADIPGEFRLSPGSTSGDAVLQLIRKDTLVDGSRIVRVEREHLQGLRSDAFAADGPVRFELGREAGVFRFEGRTQDGVIRGTFRFTENAAYAAQWKGVLPNWYEPGVMFEHAVRSTPMPASLPLLRPLEWPKLPADREAYLRALRESGYPLLKTDLERLRIHNVQPDLLRQMKLSGYDTVNTSDMVKLQTHGVTSSDVLTFQVRGYNNLSADEMVKLKVSGIPDNNSSQRQP